MDGAGSYSVAHRAGLLPTELTGMWGWILLRSPHRGRGSPPAPAPTKQRPGRDTLPDNCQLRSQNTWILERHCPWLRPWLVWKLHCPALQTLCRSTWPECMLHMESIRIYRITLKEGHHI